jgi:hypothetical protein
MHVRMSLAVNFPAAQALIAAISCGTVGLYRSLAIYGLGQCSSQRFQVLEVVGYKKVGMT